MLKNKNIVKQADYSCPEFSKPCYVGHIIHQMEHQINIKNYLLMYLTNF